MDMLLGVYMDHDWALMKEIPTIEDDANAMMKDGLLIKLVRTQVMFVKGGPAYQWSIARYGHMHVP
jgi:hypothetical protein